MKKYGKLFIIAIMTFFVSMVPVFAKEITVSQLEQEAEKICSGAIDIYVIGEYAFTTNHTITSQDIMLAARSIKVTDTEGKTNKDGVYQEMVMQHLQRDMNADGTYTAWTILDPKIGTADRKMAEDAKLNITYIDYIYLKEDAKVDTDKLVNDATKQLNEKLFKGTASGKQVTIEIVDVKADVVKGMGSNVIALLAELLSDERVESVTFAYETDSDNVIGINVTKEMLEDGTVIQWFMDNSEVIFGKAYGKVISADLIGKTFSATINLGESESLNYVSTDENKSETYEITFEGKLLEENIDELVDNAMKTVTEKGLYDANREENQVKVTIKDTNTEITQGMGSGVLAALMELVSKENVKSVEFTYTTEDGQKITLILDEAKLKDGGFIQWLIDNSEAIFGKKYGRETITNKDIVGKEFTVTVNLEDYAENTGNYDTFTIKFYASETVDTDKLVSDATKQLNQELFTATVSGKQVTVEVVDIKADVVKGMGSNVIALLAQLLSENGVKSVDFSYNPTTGDSITITVTKAILEDGTIVQWFMDNSEAIFGKAYGEVISADLIGKTFSATINLDETDAIDYTSKDGNKNETYEITFKGELQKENVDDLVDSLKDSINSGKYEVEITDDKINVTVKDVDTEITQGMGSGVLTALMELVSKENVKSVEFTYTTEDGQKITLILDEAKLKDGGFIQWLIDNSEAIFGKKYGRETITNKDIVGKEFTVTVNLEDYAENTGNYDTFTVKFEAVKHTISFDYNYDSKNETKEVSDGEVLAEENKPETNRDGYRFDGWYENDSEEPYDFTKPVKGNVSLQARWTKILSAGEMDTISKESAAKVNAYHVEVDDKNINITYDNPSDTIYSVLTAGNTGLAIAMKNLLDNGYIDSITFISNGNEVVTITPTMVESDDYAAMIVWAKPLAEALGLNVLRLYPETAAWAGGLHINSDLDGKSIQFRINLVDGVEFEEGFENLYTLTIVDQAN